MTDQKSPLLFSLSDGRQISVDQAKSVLQISDRGTQRRCMVVRGSQGAAIYNAHGEVQINGAPSSSHWLKPGDQLEFSPSLTATVQQVGELHNMIAELNSPSSELGASDFAQLAAAPTESPLPSVGSGLLGQEDTPQVQLPNEPETFKPATEAETFVPATLASTLLPEPIESPAAAPSDLTAPVDFQLPVNTVAPVSPTLDAAPEMTESAGGIESPATIEPPAATTSPATGLAAELLRQIQEEENEATGMQTPTHSPAAGGASLLPEPLETQPVLPSETVQALDFLPNDPQTTVPVEPEPQPSSAVIAFEPTAEPTTDDSEIENQTQPEDAVASNEPSDSVAAMLERMKADGQWNGLPDDEEPVAPVQEIPQPSPVAVETPAEENECEDDVQSYMSQLLNRMRGDVPVETPSPSIEETNTESNPDQQEVSLEKAIEKLRPEEFVPKTKAKRVEGWQGMRELANSQVRNAIDKSQEKKRKKSVSTVQLGIGLASGVLAIYFWMGSSFGAMSASMAVACVICSGYAIYKAYMNVLEGHKPTVGTARPIQVPTPSNAAPRVPPTSTGTH